MYILANYSLHYTDNIGFFHHFFDVLVKTNGEKKKSRGRFRTENYILAKSE